MTTYRLYTYYALKDGDRDGMWYFKHVENALRMMDKIHEIKRSKYKHSPHMYNNVAIVKITTDKKLLTNDGANPNDVIYFA